MRLKRGGQPLTVHQWANDWITCEQLRRPVSPLSVVLDSDEVALFEADRLRFEQGDTSTGRFWVWFRLLPGGVFEPTPEWDREGRGRTPSRLLRHNARREGV